MAKLNAEQVRAENRRLREVAQAAHDFLESYRPQTDRFIEATLPLDEALNRAGY